MARSTRHLSPTEAVAKRMLERFLRVPVEMHDDGSRDGMHDLSILSPTGTEAAEVVADRDPKTRKRAAAGRSMPPTIRDERLTRSWNVAYSRGAHLKTALPTLADALVELERLSAWDSLAFVEGTPEHHVLVGAKLEQARSTESSEPGRVSIFAGILLTAGAASVDDLVDYTSSVFDRHPDIGAKLRSSGAQRTHSLIVVTHDRYAELQAMDSTSDAIPARDPAVPSTISDVWLIPYWPEHRVFRWVRGSGWSQPGTMPSQF